MRVLILSDIHANLAALESVLAHAKGRYERAWCLGDVVGYGPQPNACTELIRETTELCVMGNHDWAVLDRPGINVDDFNPHARHAVLWTREELNSENRTYLETLASRPVAPDGSSGLLLTHASPREPVWEYIVTASDAMENFPAFSEPICLVGHTHKPMIYQWRLQPMDEGEAASKQTEPTRTEPARTKSEQKTWQATVNARLPKPGTIIHLKTSPSQRLIVNPGSVGQPRDNDPRAAYAILDMEMMTWQYERVPYPIELTQSQMRAVNLPRRLVDRLSFGW